VSVTKNKSYFILILLIISLYYSRSCHAGDNQIQFICENAFDHLNALIRTHVNLERNICIDKIFNLYGFDHEKYDDLAKEIQGNSNCTNYV
jgi:hypothetical protein